MLSIAYFSEKKLVSAQAARRTTFTLPHMNLYSSYRQCRSEAGAEGSVAPSLKFNTNILMHFCEDSRNFMNLKDVINFPKPLIYF
jgi:hypothetical protein